MHAGRCTSKHSLSSVVKTVGVAHTPPLLVFAPPSFVLRVYGNLPRMFVYQNSFIHSYCLSLPPPHSLFSLYSFISRSSFHQPMMQNSKGQCLVVKRVCLACARESWCRKGVSLSPCGGYLMFRIFSLF